MSNSIFVQSISFDAEGVEIVWGEERDQLGNGLRVFKTGLVPRSLIEDEMSDLIEAAEAVVDAIGVIKRAPENSFKRDR